MKKPPIKTHSFLNGNPHQLSFFPSISSSIEKQNPKIENPNNKNETQFLPKTKGFEKEREKTYQFFNVPQFSRSPQKLNKKTLI